MLFEFKKNEISNYRKREYLVSDADKRFCEEDKSISEVIEIVKGCATDQSKMQPKEDILSEIISLGEGIDNDEIYNEYTGKTIRGLYYKGGYYGKN